MIKGFMNFQGVETADLGKFIITSENIETLKREREANRMQVKYVLSKRLDIYYVPLIN